MVRARQWVGTVENPPGSNCVVFWQPWTGGSNCGYGAWCAAFTSYVVTEVGAPYPPINGAPGLSYCPDGQLAAYRTGHEVGADGVEPGDSLIFSWEAFEVRSDGAYCLYGAYAGAPAGDHIGLFVGWLGGGYMQTIEGNTSSASWSDGGAVEERSDRHVSQICAYARHAALGSGGGGALPAPPAREDDDVYQTCLITTEGHPWKGSVFLCAGGVAMGMNDGALVADLQGRGLAGPTIPVEAWTVYGAYRVEYPSGPGAVPS